MTFEIKERFFIFHCYVMSITVALRCTLFKTQEQPQCILSLKKIKLKVFLLNKCPFTNLLLYIQNKTFISLLVIGLCLFYRSHSVLGFDFAFSHNKISVSSCNYWCNHL